MFSSKPAVAIAKPRETTRMVFIFTILAEHGVEGISEPLELFAAKTSAGSKPMQNLTRQPSMFSLVD